MKPSINFFNQKFTKGDDYKRMKSTYILGIAALAMALAGCSKHDDEITDNTWNGEIRLGSEIASQVKTRAAATDVLDRQIAGGKTVSFFVDDAVTKTMLYQDYGLTADGNGGFTKFDTSAEDMYFPATGNGVDIYAFLTDGFVSGPEFPTSAITHEVKSDQSEPYGANYLSSDLLYAANKAVARTKDAVQMNFYHMLSKVEVALKAGAGVPDLTSAVVTIENTQLKANFLPDKSADINDPTNGQATRAAMVTLTTNNNVAAPITIGTQVSGDFSAFASAVVVPQTVAQNSRFIKVTLASGGELYYTLPDAGGLKMESGNKYQYKITVNLTGLTVTSTVTDWTTGAVLEGGAEMDIPPIGSKKPFDAAIGDFYFKDGTLEASNATLTMQQQATCIGIVFHVGKHTLDDSDYSGTGIGSSSLHGYVVALQDAGSDLIWEDKDNNYQTGVNVGTSASNTDWKGYSNSQKIMQYATSTDSWTLADFPAANACFNFGTSYTQYAVPPGNSGWFMPSVGQLKYLNDNREILSRQIEKLKGISEMGDISWFSSNLYWSSSEEQDYSGSAWNVFFGNNNVAPDAKGSGGNVRAVSAF